MKPSDSSEFLVVLPGPGAAQQAVFGDLQNEQNSGASLLLLEPDAKDATWRLKLAQCPALTFLCDRFSLARSFREAICFKDLRARIKSYPQRKIVFVGTTSIFMDPGRIHRIQRTIDTLKGYQTYFYFIDGIARIAAVTKNSAKRIVQKVSHFDCVCTYSAADANAFTIQFVDIPIRFIPPRSDPQTPFSLYFAGRDKRRTSLAMAIFEKISQAGGKAKFRIVSNPADRAIQNGTHPDMLFSDWVPYQTIVDEMHSANCILEIVAKHNTHSTLRFKEAVMYGKKLLTNNPGTIAEPFYDPRWMRVFKSVDDIDANWVLAKETIDYGYHGEFSLQSFFQALDALPKAAQTKIGQSKGRKHSNDIQQIS